ncbi:MAG TPA: TfoX/Sxy family protein [Ktedonobacterales bacterium]|jgi:TfoX/Sxy family transcriptional regulator of competence genes|nr:TfoX/Sxy family protein [Ktedonobacterales bacterium]
MNRETLTPSGRFETLVEAFAGAPDVTFPTDDPTAKRGFGSSALKVKDKIFAMLVNDRLVVKLPKAQVDALVATGDGERFDPRRDGREMKEWLVVAPGHEDDWLTLAQDAMRYVASQK